MGKSPAKWIKTVLFGKKSSKSNFPKRKEKASNERELSVAAKTLEYNASLAPPVVVDLTTGITTNIAEEVNLENKETVHNEGIILLAENQNADPKSVIIRDAPSGPERIRLEKAATMAQAAFRGYLARRAFRALKGIIRLQALIRGHLVRRQAVAALCCIFGIIKFQAVARGRTIRKSLTGQEVQVICSSVKLLDGGIVTSNRSDIAIRIRKLTSNTCVCKLLASSPTVMPLQLYYDPAQPNSISTWLERWSKSHFWKPIPQPKKITTAKLLHKKHGNGQTLEAETGRLKRSVRRVSASNIVNSSAQAICEVEKPKRNFRKVPPDVVQENPQSELEKVKRNLRKVQNPVVENTVRSEAETEKPKPDVQTSTSGDHLEHPVGELSVEKTKIETITTALNAPDTVDTGPTISISKLPDLETTLEPLKMHEVSEVSHDEALAEQKALVEIVVNHEDTPAANSEISYKEDPTSNENHKSGSKSSSQTKQERGENGVQNSPTLPSYMAATESAKAKLRAQGSPRFSQDGAEKTSLNRRHSLPSSTNKINSQSPRPRALHASGKGGNNSDKLASRDGNAKAVQVEWRR